VSLLGLFSTDTLEPVVAGSDDPALYVAQSPESLSRAESMHAADEPQPVRRSEDSGSSEPPQLPTHAPWDSGPNPLTTEPPSIPSTFVGTSTIKPDNATSAGATTQQPNPAALDQATSKSRTRGSTISSQVRPRTPSIPNGRLSRRPSLSSLGSSAAVWATHPGKIEPGQQDFAAVPPASR
jgi:hypothetical protein